MRLEAAIFDLNGTVLTDEDEYDTAFNKVLSRLGVDTSKTIPHQRGIGVSENWVLYIKQFSIKTKKTPEILAKETQDEYVKLLPEVRVRTGFENLAKRLKDQGVKIGLATSNTWEVTDKVLDTLNLQDEFDAITTTEEVAYNKPDPDLFIVAANKLGVDRDYCLVVEDAASGITAAKRCGMKVIGIAGDDSRVKELEEADLVVESFSEITQRAIDSL